MRQVTRFLFCSLLALASAQAMACYTVYDRSNRVLYQGEEAPVDMRLQIRDALATRFPGGHMVFDTTTDCPEVNVLAPPPPRGGTALLTDRHTAQAMRLPYTQLAGGIALVQSGSTRMDPGITVVPAEGAALASANRTGGGSVTTAIRSPNGAILELADQAGAGDATRRMGAGPAPRR